MRIRALSLGASWNSLLAAGIVAAVGLWHRATSSGGPQSPASINSLLHGQELRPAAGL